MAEILKQKVNQRHNEIARHFGAHTEGYQTHSDLQIHVAEKLAAFLPPANEVKSVLELGCGTGHLSKLLANSYQEAKLTLSDYSGDMLDYCQSILATNNPCSQPKFKRIDAAKLPEDIGKFDLIISSMTLQWLENPEAALMQWKDHLTSQGHIFFAAPAPGSFPEWSKTLEQLELDNGLLSTDLLPGSFETQVYKMEYANPLSFFKMLKLAGTGKPRASYAPLTAGQMKRALNKLSAKSPITISWPIQFGRL